MIFSNEWPEWTSAGKDRLVSHEWGHILGLPDVAADTCTNVETIMREFGPGASYGDQQLQGLAPLPAPPRPNNCDACAAKDKQAGQTLGTSCPEPTPCPENCEHLGEPGYAAVDY